MSVRTILTMNRVTPASDEERTLEGLQGTLKEGEGGHQIAVAFESPGAEDHSCRLK